MRFDKHSFVCGITGSGKTFFATKIFEQSKLPAVFINTNDETYPERISDKVVHSYNEFTEAFETENVEKICVSPRDEDISPYLVHGIIDYLFFIGKQINKGKMNPQNWIMLLIDEVQDFSSKKKPDRKIDKIWKRGRRYGILAVAMSQRPADVSHTILTQSRFHVIFNLGQYERAYFIPYRIPIFENDEYFTWIKQKYHFVIFSDGNLERYSPVKR